jgi:hypothetical protein
VGHYPHQEFVYGIYLEDYREGLMDAAEEAGFEMAFGPEDGGAAFGFKLDTFKVVDDGYLGGLWVSKFNKDYFDQWLAESIEKMTPERLAQLQELVCAKDEPALWTLSRMG